MKHILLLSLLLVWSTGCRSIGPENVIAKGDRVKAKEIDAYFINSPALNLDKLKGKVVVLDFWATWCGPCRMEIPSFVKLNQTYQSQGLQIIGLDIEKPDSQPAGYFGDFTRSYNMVYPVGFVSDKTQREYAVEAYPTTYFIDKEGKVAMVFVGVRPEEELTGVVEKLLAE